MEIFISYSHHDSSYLELLMTHLKYLEKHYSFRVWNDNNLKPGVKWSEEISKELNNSNIAILLISQHFLVSDFILKVELPSILKNAQLKGIKVIPIIVTHCMFEDYSKLSNFQSVNSPDNPLEVMKSSDINKLIKSLTNELKEFISLPSVLNKELPQLPNIKLDVMQLRILNILESDKTITGLTISEIQRLFNTNNRKDIVNSLNELININLLDKFKLDKKTKFSLTLSGSQQINLIKNVFEERK
ncbi:toll/interleukin-1 receptor domain-containing protein [Membranicola marinus]|uniref:Toll/interleukin-1 receptor domain-containing protein n=1 Tax=Membranihabitans marinus TaxID=1227546 RepID=A0A953I2H5_9BACT|nr:toll/interleukin-1 receptor domain-containing protein [Membranihabitans marinus]MBY5960047.1 toll/interleukin-1 receptor domain-containing protein [Membranihabitans marinus]